MTLTRDMIAVPAMWRLSLMIEPEAVDVVLNTSLPDQSLIYRRLQLDPSMPRLAAIENLIYENPLLLSDFSKVDVLVDTPRFTFVPSQVQSPEVSEDLVRSLWPQPELDVLSCDVPLCGETLLMAIDQGLHHFLRRTFLYSRPQHPLAVLARYFSAMSQQGNSGKIYAYLHDGAADVVAFAGTSLRIACTYPADNADDAAYYLLAAARNAGFDLSTDQILLCGDQKMRESLAPKLRALASYVLPVNLPADIFRSGQEAIAAPFPLTILPLCE